MEYVFTAHALAPFGSYLGREKGRIHVADLTTIQSYSGKIEEFQAYRVAGMTPEGRRMLRIRLAAFWGRVETEDEKWLTASGLPVGVTPREQTPTRPDPVAPVPVPAPSDAAPAPLKTEEQVTAAIAGHGVEAADQ
ncbi:hypothetical protein KZZ52_00445 [Dactylosporangium sp. AC04546]|uniref:hypothetical protein n=1 Tax=Dactylosporangium sp. AC04546 TaxID=2862460 RepID=UPI001EDEAD5A|nr:hypothetical protein [Dactylosporangium sp. AC04546]WVK83958.1 hypothetical protein KZZ52_00445 [Dactylosporangium sp. AC04546]